MKNNILSLLQNSNDYISGEHMSKTLGVSRNSVWKHINKLRSEGYEIDSVTNKGYKLLYVPDILNNTIISNGLKTTFIGKNILYYDEIDSTNTAAKRHSSEIEGTVFTADLQTGGKGRLGRGWAGVSGDNVAFSILLRPKISLDKVSQLTLIAGISVRRAISNLYGLDAKIKWPNDIVVGKKKICGILTEMSAEMNGLNYVVCGIGVNVNSESFDGELKSKATSIFIETKQKQKRYILIQEILNQFEILYLEFLKNGLTKMLDEYKTFCVTLNRDVKVIKNGTALIAKAVDITQNGELIIEKDGENICVNSGEVSVRGIYDYI